MRRSSSTAVAVRSVLSGVVLSLFGASPSAAQVPGFHFVGFAPGTTTSGVSSLSADGRVAAGGSVSNFIGPGFTWTVAGGRVDFGLEASLPAFTGARGISGDATTVVGASRPSGPARAYRYRGPGTYQDLGTIGTWPESYAQGVSGDGSVVVGHVQTVLGPNPTLGRAFRWNASGGMQDLGLTSTTHIYSEATAVSRDGTTIVGHSQSSGGRSDAFVWRESTGMLVLPPLATTGSSIADAVNFDGSIIAGISGTQGSAALWVNGQPIDLGIPPGWNSARARGLSDNGTVVAVTLSSATGLTAGVWTSQDGWEVLSEYLARQGVSVPAGWSLYSCTAVSADGLTFAGDAFSGTAFQGFVATIPAPGALPVLGVGLLMIPRRR